MIPFHGLITLAPLFAITTLPRILLCVVQSIADTDAIVANGAKKFLATGTPTLINGPANLPNKTPRNPLD